MRILVFAVCLLGMLGSTATELSAQAASGSVTGVIRDASGRPVPDVTVQLTDRNTGRQMTATTDSDGRYRFDNVAFGRHSITIAARQSGPSDAGNAGRDIEVSGAGPASMDLTWDSSGARGTPQTDGIVSGETVPLQTDSGQIRQDWNTPNVQYSPQSNLTHGSGAAFGAYNLSVTSEAVATQGGPALGPAVAGQRPESNNFRIQGFDNTNKVNPGPLVYLSNEATQDFALFQAQATPVFGHSIGGKFNSTMRSGANQVHGSIYNYLQNRWFNAMEPVASRSGLEDNPRYDQNRIGGSIGLPILPSKLFFFGNFEYIPLGFQTPAGGGGLAPTEAGFAGLATTPGISATNLGILQSSVGTLPAEPVTTTIIAGRSVPLGYIGTLGRGYQNKWIGAGGLDWNLGNVDTLRARYVHNEIETRSAGQALPFFTTNSDTRALMAGISHHHAFAGNTVNELRLGYNRWDHRPNMGADEFTFPGLNAFPNIQIGGETDFALGPNFGQRDFTVYNTYQLADALSFNLWGHNFRVGGDALRTLSSLGPLASARGSFTYSNLERFLLDQAPDVAWQQAFGSTTMNDNRWLVTGFVQDTWNAWPGVSVNLGVRYQYSTIPSFLERQAMNSANTFGGNDGLNFATPREDTNNWAPNVGFAWSPGQNRTTVFRAGFAMQYDMLNNPWANFGAFSPQVGTVLSGTTAGNAPGFLGFGGVQNPYPVSGDLTDAQARALTSGYAGDIETPYTMQWNAGVQQKLWRATTLQVRYLGARTRNIPILSFANLQSPITAQQSLPVYTDTTPTQSELNQLPYTLGQLQALPINRFAAQGFANPILTFTQDGRSNYDAMAVNLNQKLGSLNLLGTYTWSHLVDDSTGTLMDLTFGKQRADSIYDRRHRGTITGVFDMAPLFQNTGSVLRNIFANLNLSGTYIYQSPAFMPVFSNSNAGFTGFGFATPAIMNPGADNNLSSGVTPLRNSFGQVVAYQANNPNARFIQAGPGAYEQGIRNAFELDPVNNVDLSAVKRFSWGDRMAVEVRADAYNLFNSKQFTGVPLSSFDFRSSMFAPSWLVAGSSNFGDPKGYLTANPRQLQLALRVTF